MQFGPLGVKIKNIRVEQFIENIHCKKVDGPRGVNFIFKMNKKVFFG